MKPSGPDTPLRRLRFQTALILLPVLGLAVAGFLALSRDRAAVESEARERSRQIAEDLVEDLAGALPGMFDLSSSSDSGGKKETDGSAPKPWEFVRLVWDESGRLLWPPGYPPIPQPPARRRHSTEDSVTLSSGATSPDPNPDTEEDPTSAHRAALSGKAPADTLFQLAWEAIRQRMESDTGLPLGLSLFAEACRRRDSNGPLAGVYRHVVNALVVDQPSLLSPWVLDSADALATHSADRQWVAELRGVWIRQEQLRAMASHLEREGGMPRAAWTGGWLAYQGTNWWTWRVRPNAVPGEMAFIFIPSRPLARAVTRMSGLEGDTTRRPLRLPPGTRIAFELEGRSLDDSQTVSPDNADGISPPVLASVTRFLEKTSSATGGPALTVRVLLSDAPALFAAQRRQQRLFGGLIAGSAAVAGIGVWQTRRAFRRQVALAEQKSNFVSSVSHELRAPLASLRLVAEGLAEGRASHPDKLREYSGFLVQETRRLGSLVENVLDFSRIEQGRQRYDLEPTDAPRLVRDTVRLMQPLADERRVRIEVEIQFPEETAGGAPAANWDGRAMQQALVNLLDNALKHAPEGSVVTVRLASEGAPRRTLRLSVQDQGPGIPREDHERIFERFYRRGSELRRETQGIGLGLAIVRHIVQAHHGTITVDSAPGRGATFTIETPLPESGDTPDPLAA
ncbi:MAG: HAMP domain-containing histidine kinase [Verrucomicrobiae bacterium]|nr:HAMP domain-containing histidine kinase [Verrucomicrobiae bacterium]